MSNTIVEQLSNIAVQPSRLDGETNYTEALKRAIDSLDPELGGVINFPQGKELEFDILVINKKNVTITGGGTAKGKIIINVDTDYANVKIENIRFINEIPIEIKQGRGIRIIDCTFENNDKSIFVNPSVNAGFHRISMVSMTRNHFRNVNYALYIFKSVNSINTLLSNDFIFAHNIVNKANITHIYADEIDGIIITNNTFFFPNFELKDSKKEYNIRIKGGDWVIITENNLFESGYESIYVTNVRRPLIQGNNIAWCGQRSPSSGIKAEYIGEGTSIPNVAYIHANISNNNIVKSTRHGIELVNMVALNIKNNTLDVGTSNNSTSSYYGDMDLSTLDHYGVDIESDYNYLPFVDVYSNLCLGVKETNKKFNTSEKQFDKYYVITENTKTLDAIYNRLFEFRQTSQNEISDILPRNSNMKGTIITLLFTNSNTTLINNSNISLQNRMNYNPKNGDVIFLMYSGSQWIEISRFQKDKYVTEIVNKIIRTSTNIDLSNNPDTVTLESSTAKTFAVSGGSDGLVVDLIGKNGNATIQYNDSTVKLKGGVDVTVPKDGVLRLKKHNGIWYEVSRSW